MTDRELLERAAKAAGYYLRPLEESEGRNEVTTSGFDAIKYHYAEWHSWDPLTDDGDALRLAVKLHMFIDVTEEGAGAQLLNVAFNSQPHNNDPYAATRRAIVRAAAAMCEQGEK